MPDASVFVDNETNEPATVDLTDDTGLGEEGEPYTLAEVLDDALGGQHVETITVVSEFSLLAAIHALQEVMTDRGPDDPVFVTAHRALGEIAMSRDIDEYAEPGPDGSWEPWPVHRTEHGGYAWAAPATGLEDHDG